MRIVGVAGLTNLTVRPRDVGAITNQPTSLDKFAPSVSRGQRMTCRKCDDFNAPVREERIGSNEERVGVLVLQTILYTRSARRLLSAIEKGASEFFDLACRHSLDDDASDILDSVLAEIEQTSTVRALL
jgi:hypothetical protein